MNSWWYIVAKLNMGEFPCPLHAAYLREQVTVVSQFGIVNQVWKENNLQYSISLFA
jgi:hypothetical protein